MRMPDGQAVELKVRSLVGLLPLCAATVFDPEVVADHPWLLERAEAFVAHFADAVPALAHLPGPNPDGDRLLSLVDEPRLRRILEVMLDEAEFLGPYGIRSVSRRHLDQPVEFDWGGQHYEVRYLPAESDTGMFGGNSNWRGPVWFPMNLVILRGLVQLHRYYGDRLKVECPTGSGTLLDLRQVAGLIADRLTRTFLRGEDGRRPVFGGLEPFQSDPHWRELLLFHEYFQDRGAGVILAGETKKHTDSIVSSGSQPTSTARAWRSLDGDGNEDASELFFVRLRIFCDRGRSPGGHRRGDHIAVFVYGEAC